MFLILSHTSRGFSVKKNNSEELSHKVYILIISTLVNGTLDDYERLTLVMELVEKSVVDEA
jgi:hypothetical protein